MAEVKLNDISSNSDSARKAEETALQALDNADTSKPPKKRNFVGKALDNIGVNTDVGGAGKSIWEDVVVPAFLDVCRDAMYAAADYIFGGTGRRTRAKKDRRTGYTSYSAKSTQKVIKKQPNAASYYLEWEERQQAQDVLDSMFDVLDTHRSVSIQDMLTIDHKTTSNYMLSDWGWKDLSRVMVRKNSSGLYYLDLPRPVDLTENN